jgi:hypothetical protein
MGGGGECADILSWAGLRGSAWSLYACGGGGMGGGGGPE